MTQQGDFRFNWGRWLMWGLVALGGLAAIIFIVIALGDEAKQPDEGATGSTLVPAAGTDQVEWQIAAGAFTPNPGLITLKGDLPLGAMTETWLEESMLARTADSSFTWKMDADPPAPLPAYEIDQLTSCEDLQVKLDEWAEAMGVAFGEASRAEASAFAQHAFDTMEAMGCEISILGNPVG